MKPWVLVLMLVLPVALAQAPQIALEPLPPVLEERARAIGQELRCPVCNGLPIAESPSDFARNMQNEVRRQVREGKTEAQIVAFFQERYGNDVLMTPPKTGWGLLFWLAPLAFVVAGLAALLVYLRRASQAVDGISAAELEGVRAALDASKQGQA